MNMQETLSVSLAAIDAEIAKLTKARESLAAIIGGGFTVEPAAAAAALAAEATPGKAQPDAAKKPRASGNTFNRVLMSLLGGPKKTAEIAAELSLEVKAVMYHLTSNPTYFQKTESGVGVMGHRRPWTLTEKGRELAAM